MINSAPTDSGSEGAALKAVSPNKQVRSTANSAAGCGEAAKPKTHSSGPKEVQTHPTDPSDDSQSQKDDPS